MKSLFNYIITTNKRYNNIVDVDGNELVVNSEITERDAQFVNRIGTVLSLPMLFESPVDIGEEVIVHHNVFRSWYGKDKKERNSSNYLGENTFFLAPDQLFGYKKNGEWIASEGYCFVEPILDHDRWSVAHKRGLLGVVAFGDKESPLKGTKIGFTPDSEYEFIIDGKLYYRILSNHITHEYKKETTESAESSGQRVRATTQGS